MVCADAVTFEPARETQILVMDLEVGHMKTSFHIVGPLIYIDGACN